MASRKELPKGMTPGRRLLPVVIDHCANKNPTRVWASIPRRENIANGFQDITYREFADAINRASWWLESVLGKGRGHFETFGYIGPNDIRYPVLAIAAIKLGKTMLLPSPGLAMKAHMHLLDSTGCRTYICTDASEFVVRTFETEWKKLRVAHSPHIDDWFNDDPVAPYVYDKPWDIAKDEPTLIFPTGGTTGLPRPIVYTNSMMTVFDAGNFLPNPSEFVYNHFANRRVYSSLPAMHVIGMFLALQLTVFWGMTLVMGPATDPSDLPIEVVAQVLAKGSIRGAIFPSSLLEQLSQNPTTFSLITKLRFVAFAGAPLSPFAGNLISENTTLVPMIGSTEVGLFTSIILSRQNWNYYKFSPQNGFEFERHSGDLYELVVHKKPDLERFQQIFYIYPELDTFRTKDLFTQHPTEHDTWTFAGRTDDVVTLTTGRLYVKSMEAAIQADPLVTVALIGGERRKRPFLLVETVQTKSSGNPRDVIDALGPAIARANSFAGDPVFRISRDLVVLAHPGKPLKMAESGVVWRRESLELYLPEINALFAAKEGGGGIGKRFGGALKRALTTSERGGGGTPPNAGTPTSSAPNSRPSTPGAGLAPPTVGGSGTISSPGSAASSQPVTPAGSRPGTPGDGHRRAPSAPSSAPGSRPGTPKGDNARRPPATSLDYDPFPSLNRTFKDGLPTVSNPGSRTASPARPPVSHSRSRSDNPRQAPMGMPAPYEQFPAVHASSRTPSPSARQVSTNRPSASGGDNPRRAPTGGPAPYDQFTIPPSVSRNASPARQETAYRPATSSGDNTRRTPGNTTAPYDQFSTPPSIARSALPSRQETFATKASPSDSDNVRHTPGGATQPPYDQFASLSKIYNDVLNSGTAQLQAQHQAQHQAQQSTRAATAAAAAGGGGGGIGGGGGGGGGEAQQAKPQTAARTTTPSHSRSASGVAVEVAAPPQQLSRVQEEVPIVFREATTPVLETRGVRPVLNVSMPGQGMPVAGWEEEEKGREDLKNSWT